MNQQMDIPDNTCVVECNSEILIQTLTIAAKMPRVSYSQIFDTRW